MEVMEEVMEEVIDRRGDGGGGGGGYLVVLKGVEFLPATLNNSGDVVI